MNFLNRAEYWFTVAGPEKYFSNTSFKRAIGDRLRTWYWWEIAQKFKYTLTHSSESLSCFWALPSFRVSFDVWTVTSASPAAWESLRLESEKSFNFF